MRISEQEWQEILCQVINNEITSLNLNSNIIGEGGAKSLSEALKKNQSLTSLYLRSNNIGEGGARSLSEALKKNQSLTYLDLTCNNIGEGGARSLSEALEKNQSLTSLNLEWNNIGEGGASALAEALKVSSSLTCLKLKDNDIGDEGARSLAEALRENSSLTYLDLNGNNIGEGGVRALAETLQENSSLTSLDLGSNRIGEGVARSLAEVLKENNSLTNLNLRWNNIGEGGARKLSEALEKNQSLTSLDLFKNNIGDEGARSLSEALEKNQSLTSLNLVGNNIGEEGARSLSEALKKNQSLTSLYLEVNNIGEGGASALAEALKVNKCLSYYLVKDSDELESLINKNKNNNENLAKIINREFNSYLEALFAGGSIDASRGLNLEDLKLRCAAINYMLKKEDIGATPEIVLFFNIAFKKLQNSEESYNSTSGLFEAAMTELAIRLSEGYYEHPRDYPGLYIQDKLLEEKAYKISDEGKEKLLAIPSVSLYNAAIGASEQGKHEEALKNLEEALVKAPGEPRIMLEKVKVLYLLGCFEQADEEFSGSLGTDITTSDKFIEVRDWFEKQGEFDKAITLQEKIIRDTGDNSGLAKLALLKFENHSPDEALESLDKLVEHEPEEFSAYHLKAKFHYILADGGFDELIKAGEEKAKPKPAEYYKLGDWLDKHADTSRAYEYNIKADKLSDQAFLAEIYANWFKQHSDFQKDISALPGEINYLSSDSIKHAKELKEFEEVIDIRVEGDVQVLGENS